MKKNIFLVVLFAVLATGSTMAQMSFGLKWTPLNTNKLVGDYTNYGRLNSDDASKRSEDYEAFSSLLNLGFTMKYEFDNPLTVTSEFNYKRQGFQDESASEVFKLDYIEIPLLAGYSRGDKTKFFVNFGPSVKFLTRAEHEFELDGVADDDDVKASLTLFKPVVLAANLGIGISHEINEYISLSAEFRYGHDLTRVAGDTTDDDDDTYYGDKEFVSGEVWDFKTSHFSQYELSIGVAFTIR